MAAGACSLACAAMQLRGPRRQLTAPACTGQSRTADVPGGSIATAGWTQASCECLKLPPIQICRPRVGRLCALSSSCCCYCLSECLGHAAPRGLLLRASSCAAGPAFASLARSQALADKWAAYLLAQRKWRKVPLLVRALGNDHRGGFVWRLTNSYLLSPVARDTPSCTLATAICVFLILR